MTAAFRATYSDWKVVKGRKVVQVVLELPLETADQAYQVLGGMPMAANEIWCAVARLDERKVVSPDTAKEASASNARHKPDTTPQPDQSVGVPAGAKVRRKFEDLTPAQQAGILCGQPSFRIFLSKRFNYGVTTDEEAAEAVRELCKVKSRALLTTDNADWSGLLLAFRLWESHPELEDA